MPPPTRPDVCAHGQLWIRPGFLECVACGQRFAQYSHSFTINFHTNIPVSSPTPVPKADHPVVVKRPILGKDPGPGVPAWNDPKKDWLEE